MKKSKNINTLEDALRRIEELENECNFLRAQLSEYEKRPLAGRKPHNEKWQADYTIFVEHYEQGESISSIIESTPFSRRTIYRYKQYYEQQKNNGKDT